MGWLHRLLGNVWNNQRLNIAMLGLVIGIHVINPDKGLAHVSPFVRRLQTLRYWSNNPRIRLLFTAGATAEHCHLLRFST